MSELVKCKREAVVGIRQILVQYCVNRIDDEDDDDDDDDD